MRNKPKPNPNPHVYTFNFDLGYLFVPSKKKKVYSTFESFHKLLQKLDIASEYYEDYDCLDSREWIDLVLNMAKDVEIEYEEEVRFAYVFDSIPSIDIKEIIEEDLVTLGRQTQSRQLIQALVLDLEIRMCPCPSSFLVDSS